MCRAFPATLVLIAASISATAEAAPAGPTPAGPVEGDVPPEGDGPEAPAAEEVGEAEARTVEAEAEPQGDSGPTDEGEGVAEGRVEASLGANGTGGRIAGRTGRGPRAAKPSKRLDQPWIRRWAPEPGMWELGPYLGVLFPSRNHELFEADLDLGPRQGFRRMKVAAFDVGGRVGYYPMRWFGLEVEGGYAPTRTADLDRRVHLWMVRGHVVGQLGLWSVTPFVLVGGGVIAASSKRDALGDDVDQSLHVGIGTKVYINRWMQARFDLRDVIAPARGINGGPTNNIELLLGFSFTLGRGRDEPKAPPTAREPAPDPGPADSDGDGFVDPDDRCPDVPGVAPDGCPAPTDRDGDGFVDAEDACPDEPGVAPDGCPDRDPDRDQILDPDDQCPDQPETRNGFEDDDGCPDELPEEVTRFTGTIEGVYFDVDKATLRPQSRTRLDEAVAVLKKYPKVRVEISGHTDSTGRREHNMELSRARAEAVKDYLVQQGIDAGRIQTRGAGPDEPIDSNATRQGRSKNRRIEFRVLD